MYDPLFIPDVSQKLMPLDDVRFGINYSDDYRTPDDPQSDPLHIHDYTEIFFLACGEASFLINDRIYRVGGGTAVISQAKEVHMCILEKPCRFEHFCLWISAPENSRILSAFESKNFSPVISFDEQTKTQIVTLLHTLLNCRGEDSQTKKTISFLQIVTLLQDKRTRIGDNLQLPQEMQRILSDINQNFMNIYSVKDLLPSYYVSPATLNRWFRKYLLLSPHKYLESKKLAYSAKLLADGASVTNAATEAGFSDCSHFIALFRKKFGETPLRYKKKFGAKAINSDGSAAN